MKVKMLTVMVVLGLVLGPGAVSGQSIPDQCQSPDDSDMQEVCSDFRDLHRNYTETRTQLQRLQEEEREGIPETLKEDMKRIGAEHPETGEFSLVYVRYEDGFNPAIYQFVGPGQGDTGWNDQFAHITDITRDSLEMEDNTTGTLHIPLEYSTDETPTHIEVRIDPATGKFDTQKIESEIMSIQDEMNTGSGLVAYYEHTQGELESAQTASTVSWVGVGFIIVVLGLGSFTGWKVIYRRMGHHVDQIHREYDGFIDEPNWFKVRLEALKRTLKG